jgi:hypothetical protein
MFGMLTVDAWLAAHSPHSEARWLVTLIAASVFVLLPALILVIGPPLYRRSKGSLHATGRNTFTPGVWFRILCWFIAAGVFGLPYAALLNALFASWA